MTISARNWAWEHPGDLSSSDGKATPLKPGEKLTLLCLAESENATHGYAFPSHKTIALRTGQTERTVQTHIAALVRIGAVEVGRRKSNGRWIRNVYVLSVPDSYRNTDPEWVRAESVRQ